MFVIRVASGRVPCDLRRRAQSQLFLISGDAHRAQCPLPLRSHLTHHAMQVAMLVRSFCVGSPAKQHSRQCAEHPIASLDEALRAPICIASSSWATWIAIHSGQSRDPIRPVSRSHLACLAIHVAFSSRTACNRAECIVTGIASLPSTSVVHCRMALGSGRRHEARRIAIRAVSRRRPRHAPFLSLPL